MTNFIVEIKNKVLSGDYLNYAEAIELSKIDENDIKSLSVLFEGANEIRKKFMNDEFNLCTIMNVKSGSCSEDCKFCAQSVFYNTGVNEYSILAYDEILNMALELENRGVHRFSLVSSGRGCSENDFEKIIEIYERLKRDTNLNLCASLGIISYDQAKRLKEAGVSLYHHNVETSSENYENVCTTHTYGDRIQTIKNCIKANLDVCCGGIIGMNESFEDRIKMVFEIRKLNIKSIPINVLSPIKGTPFENFEVLDSMEILKFMAIYRYIMPDAYIRYAGGRMALKDKMNIGLKSGVNSAIVGNYLTTIGRNIDDDINMIIQEGFKI